MIPGTDLHQFNVYNDGYFAYLPLTYVDGVILEIAIPRMPYEQVVEFLEEKLTLYLDHLDMNLSEYLSQVITYDMDDLVSKKIGPPRKRYGNDFSVDEMVDWAEMEVETEFVEARTSTIDGVGARNSTTDAVVIKDFYNKSSLSRLCPDAVTKSSDVVTRWITTASLYAYESVTPSSRSVSNTSSRIWCRSIISFVSSLNEPKSHVLLGLKDFKMMFRVTTTQLQLLSDYYCWKDYADRDEIKD
ncbi:hypothetical protein Tco_1200091 [Tanacetum coccineum]